VVVALAAWAVLLVVSLILSAAETAVLLLTAGRIHRLSESYRPGAPALSELAERRHHLRATAELSSAIAYGASALSGWLIGSDMGSVLASVGCALLGLLLTYSLSQALPKAFAVTNPERIALSTAGFALVVTRILYPLAGGLGAPWKGVIALTGAARPYSPWAVTPDAFRSAEASDDAEREEAEEALLEAVSDFAEKVVREVMVPRTDMVTIEDTASIDDAITLIASTGVSRVPLYRSTIDDVVGVLYAKDLLTAYRSDVQPALSDLAREAYFVPETKPVEELLVEMRTQTHIALVADEYGGTAGLITLEDLLEEIVGDIADEYDREVPLVTTLGDGRWAVDARLPVDDLDELFGTDLDTEADSVGGLFTEVAGHIPQRGESLEFEGVRLTVTDLKGTRILKLIAESAVAGGQGDYDA